VRAVAQATIATELQARVARVGFQDGERFRKGDTLIEFDCRKQLAELKAAEAQRHEMQLSLDNNLALQRAQAVGRHDLEISRARLAKASAEVEAMKARIDLCWIVAPFDGRVAELTINAHETPQPGKPFISIVADGALEIDLVLPSDWLRWLEIGTAFRFVVDETQTGHDARVLRLGATVDAISQTVKAVAVFVTLPQAVLPGMSGSAEFRRGGE
jgi:RND family efflux transporter MFP subunit